MIFLPQRNTKVCTKVHKDKKRTYTELHSVNTELHREFTDKLLFFCTVPYTLYLEPRLGQIYLIIIMVVKMIFEHMI